MKINVTNSINISQLWRFKRWKHLRNIHSPNFLDSKSNLIESSGKKNIDVIGPPDEISNLRPIIFAKPEDETKLEKTYREAREKTQNWNQKFWSEHNSKFIMERKQFQKSINTEGNGSITADQMSVFYKHFLDKNWKNHLNYNVSWYKQNLRILFLELRVRFSKFKFK